MPKHRAHWNECKLQVVPQFHVGGSLRALARRHCLSRNLMRIWTPSTELVCSTSSTVTTDVLADCEARMVARERLAGRLRCDQFPRSSSKSAITDPSTTPSKQVSG